MEAHEPQHDEINLVRLVRRLEKSVSNQQEWHGSERKEYTWLKAQNGLQRLKFARNLLKNVELYDYDAPPKKTQQRNDIKIKLDRFEVYLKEIAQRTAPVLARPPPILPEIPIPEPKKLPVEEVVVLPTEEPPEESSSPAVVSAIPSLLPVQRSAPITSTSTALAHGTAQIAPRKNLQASSALQDELTNQLAQMSAQLKRNAIYFSESLSKDKAVVEDTQLKIEGNFDVMQKERLRLRDHRGKSLGTTGLTIAILVVVLLLFMLMVSAIRFS